MKNLFFIFKSIFKGIIFSDGEPDPNEVARRLGVQILEVENEGIENNTDVKDKTEVKSNEDTDNSDEKTEDSDENEEVKEDTDEEQEEKEEQEEQEKEEKQEEYEDKQEVDGDSDEYVSLGKYKVNEKEFKIIYNSAVKHFGEDFNKLDDNLKNKILEDRYHILQAKKVADKRSQIQANDRKEIELEKTKIVEGFKKLQEYEEAIKKEKQNIQKVLDLDPYDEEDDVKRSEIILDQKEAKKKLEQIEGKGGLEEKIKKAKEELILQNQINYYIACKENLISNFPSEFKTDMEYEDINEQLENNTYKGDPKDAQIVLKFKKLYNDYLSQTDEYRRNNSIVDFYKLSKDIYPSVKKDTKVSVQKKSDNKKKATDPSYELYKKLVNKQKGNINVPPPGASGNISVDNDLDANFRKYQKNAQDRLLGAREPEI